MRMVLFQDSYRRTQLLHALSRGPLVWISPEWPHERRHGDPADSPARDARKIVHFDTRCIKTPVFCISSQVNGWRDNRNTRYKKDRRGHRAHYQFDGDDSGHHRPLDLRLFGRAVQGHQGKAPIRRDIITRRQPSHRHHHQLCFHVRRLSAAAAASSHRGMSWSPFSFRRSGPLPPAPASYCHRSISTSKVTWTTHAAHSTRTDNKSAKTSLIWWFGSVRNRREWKKPTSI